MSKKSKVKSIEIPEMYQMLTLPLKKEGADRKIVIDTDGHIHVFKDKSVAVPTDITPDKVFDNFDKFVEQQKQTVLAYHEEHFKCEPPKGQSLVTTAAYVWSFFLKGIPHLEGHKSDGTRERKSSLGGRKYILGNKAADFEKYSGTYPPQMKSCFYFVQQSLNTSQSTFITEDQLKEVVTRRAAELRTRQDPWRIFQYYRPRLIQEGMVRYE